MRGEGAAIGKRIGRRAWSALAMACAASSAQPAFAAIDDLQIDWVIPASEFGTRSIPSVDGRIAVTVRPLPRELFAAETEIVGSDGTKLLPAGAQLYRMTGPTLMACSQAPVGEGYVGASSRVCVRDTNGDGVADAYFTRSWGRSAIIGDQMWFAMNNKLPRKMPWLMPVTLTKVANTEATERPTMNLEFFSDKKGRIFSAVTVDGRYRFDNRCLPGVRVGIENPAHVAVCLAPGLVTRWTNLASDSPWEHTAVLEVPGRPLTLRFDVAPRVFGARNLSGIHFE